MRVDLDEGQGCRVYMVHSRNRAPQAVVPHRTRRRPTCGRAHAAVAGQGLRGARLDGRVRAAWRAGCAAAGRRHPPRRLVLHVCVSHQSACCRGCVPRRMNMSQCTVLRSAWELCTARICARTRGPVLQSWSTQVVNKSLYSHLCATTAPDLASSSTQQPISQHAPQPPHDPTTLSSVSYSI